MACLRKILMFYFRARNIKERINRRITECISLYDIEYGAGNKLLEITTNHPLRMLGMDEDQKTRDFLPDSGFPIHHADGFFSCAEAF